MNNLKETAKEIEVCAYCPNTNIVKYGGKSEPICYKCAGIKNTDNIRGSNRIPKKKKRKKR